MVDGLQAIIDIFRKPDSGVYTRFRRHPLLLPLASSRLPPFAVGTAILTDHADIKSKVGIARSQICRSVHRPQPDTPFPPFVQYVCRSHEETEGGF